MLDPRTILSNVSLLELTPKYNFFVSFINTYGQLNANFARYSTNYPLDPSLSSVSANLVELGINLQNTMFSVKSVDIPEIIVNGRLIDIGTTKLYSITGADVGGDLLIEFHPESRNFAKKFYYTWLSTMISPVDNTKRPRNTYEADIDLYIYNRNFTPIEFRTYHGCVPINLEKQRYDVNETGYLESIALTFKVNNGATINLV